MNSFFTTTGRIIVLPLEDFSETSGQVLPHLTLEKKDGGRSNDRIPVSIMRRLAMGGSFACGSMGFDALEAGEAIQVHLTMRWGRGKGKTHETIAEVRMQKVAGSSDSKPRFCPSCHFEPFTIG